MRKVTFLFLLFITSNAIGQFNEAAPWMNTTDQKKTNRHQSMEQLNNAFNAYWIGKDHRKKGSGYKPFKRWQNHWRHQLSKNGALATPEFIWKSWQQKNSLSKSAVSNWKSIGPYTTNVKQGQGRVNTFIIDPNAPNTYYVGAPAGGLWRSTDAGLNWMPLTDELPQIGVSGIAIDKNNSNVIYIATGDDDARDTYSVGVLKSTDRGTTWKKTGLDFSSMNAISNEIYIHPENSDILWVSTNQGFFKSTDAGQNWSKKIANNIVDFKLKPDDPDVVYAVSRSKFYRSTNGGENFTLVSSGLPESSARFAIDVSPANSDVVYLLSSNIDDNSFQGLYKSIDAGVSFNTTEVLEDIFGGSTQAWYDMALTVSPVDAEVVLVGVLDIWRSDDGGKSFVQKNRWWDPSDPAYTHADIHFLRYFNGNLFAGTDGGIYMSSNNADSFVDLTENLSISQYYKISTAKSNASNIVGGLQDNGGFGYSNGTWHEYHGGDGMDCVVDPNDENIYYGFSQYGGRLNVTYNGGQTQGGTVTEAPKEEVDDDNQDSGGNWVTPLEANQKGNLYAGYSRVYQLVNNQWEAVSSDVFGGDLNNLSIAPSNEQVMYASRINKLFKSSDKGISFEEIDFMFSNLISSVEINHQDENIIYVTTSGTNGQVLKSIDGGSNWQDISGNLPDDSKLVIKHQNQSLVNDLFLGTNISVYHINDTMTQWEVFDEGLPNAPVYDIEINIEDRIITAGTYGRGVFQSPIEVSKANVDLSLLSINTNNSVQCNGITPVITVKNNGVNLIQSILIKYQVDGVPFEYTYNGEISSEEVRQIELPNNSEIAMGPHELVVEISAQNDAFGDNNVLYASFTSNSQGEGQYVNTFGDVNEDQWLEITLGDSNGLWEKSEATSNQFKNKLNKVYVTNANGNYYDETTSYLISPCYDLSKLENPMIKFDMIFDIELNWDVLYLEYSVDKGENWLILGSSNDPNWYNSNFIDPQRPITVGRQWTGTDLTVKEYSYDLSDLSKEPNVIFRFVFASDQAENGEGAAIDNFTVAATAVLAAGDFEKNNFKLYPNPSSSVFYIQRPGFEEMNISVYDPTGRLIFEEMNINKSNYALDLSKVTAGLYFLKINEGGKILATGIIKQ
ncbi:VPS10 domain-containing protein [Lutimonas vermicola]|uniref:T9SS type A sorting domain-containing protein n=1 Tax=Lutimonas vermicola TaxID=414288 RepID=A0ABU9L245_9FLAO